jgi:hypothetical protein
VSRISFGAAFGRQSIVRFFGSFIDRRFQHTVVGRSDNRLHDFRRLAFEPIDGQVLREFDLRSTFGHASPFGHAARLSAKRHRRQREDDAVFRIGDRL